MMKLSKTAIEALRIMAFFAERGSGHVLTRTNVAEQLDMPVDAALVAIRRLTRHGLVDSLRGRNGGFVLARHPSQITLLDIVTAAEWSLIQEVRLPHGVAADAALTVMEQTCRHAVDAAQSYLRRVTLADLAAMLTDANATAWGREPLEQNRLP